MVLLGDVCEVRAGANYKDVEDPNGRYPIYGTGGIMGRASQYRCPAHSVIVGRKGTLDNPFLVHEPFWNIDTCFGVVPSGKIVPEYLFRFCQGFDFYSLVPASGRPSTTSDAVRSIEIPLPPLSVQREIVARLERELAAVEKMKKGFEALAETAKAEFKAELKEVFEEDCSCEKTWDEVFYTTTGKLDSNCAISDGKYPFFTCSKEVLRINEWAFDCEALLLAGNNAAGKYDVKHYVGKFNAYQRTYVLTLKNADWEYKLFQAQLENLLQYLQDKSKGTGTRYLTMGILRTLRFYVPEPFVQREVVARLDGAKAKAEKLEAKAQEGVAVCETMRKAILKEAFSPYGAGEVAL
ncbi:MAG: restriction endonuclease subunit S [Kiritimatiellae bacterium]|nr:restriction endonuclease subunit S [Kiritimatiellia bacterium]